MGRIVVYSMAYRGDVYPYVPIAAALARDGHDVTYVVPREFHADFASEPFRCVHSGTDFGPVALDERAAVVDRLGNRLGGTFLLRFYLREFAIPFLDTLFDAVDAEVAGADLVVSHPAPALIAGMSCERRGVPLLVGDLFPMLVPSERSAMAGMPYLGRRVNRAVIGLSRSRLSDPVTCGRELRAYRARLGLANDGWNVLDARLSSQVNLGLAPAAYVPPQPDWPANYRLVGFTPWAGPAGGALDDEVTSFLDGGEPPVVVTLGTSAASARPEVFDAAVHALDGRRARGVFLTSNAAIAARVRALAGGAHLVRPFVPLGGLLGRVRAIVHSGSHGTNALALLAGVPSVVVPCLFDQVAHARRQRELGTGVWARRARHLGDALGEVLDSPRYAARAAAFAREIGDDDGVAATVDEVRSLLGAT